MRLQIRFILALLFLAGFCAAAARADEEAAPQEYTRVTRNKKFVFVMLPPKPFDKYGTLKTRYPASGLYPNNGSNKPLWTVPWYEFDVDVASDGKHLVRWGPWPRTGDRFDTLALAFYENGREIKRYRVRDLVARPEALPRTVSHYHWLEGKTFDDRGGRVGVTTLQRHDPATGVRYLRKYVFDLASGRVVKGRLPPETEGRSLPKQARTGTGFLMPRSRARAANGVPLPVRAAPTTAARRADGRPF